jgi:sulfate adenylyltransferase (ADP) / adenylylsulfatase
MQRIGEGVLSRICEERGLEKRFRFGFHLPPYNSVDHIHLHCFIEPLSGWMYNRVHYGVLFKGVEGVLERL